MNGSITPRCLHSSSWDYISSIMEFTSYCFKSVMVFRFKILFRNRLIKFDDYRFKIDVERV